MTNPSSISTTARWPTTRLPNACRHPNITQNQNLSTRSQRARIPILQCPSYIFTIQYYICFPVFCVFIVAEIKQFWPGEKINDAHCLPGLQESANNRSHFYSVGLWWWYVTLQSFICVCVKCVTNSTNIFTP